MKWLQSAQDTAAYPASRAGPRDHITVRNCRQLHWLPVRQRARPTFQYIRGGRSLAFMIALPQCASGKSRRRLGVRGTHLSSGQLYYRSLQTMYSVCVC